MRRLFIAALIIGTAATSAGANPLHRDRFVDAKSGYVVETREIGGTLRITGRHPQSGRTFALKVLSHDRVTGTWNGRPVSFRLGEDPNVELATAAPAGAK